MQCPDDNTLAEFMQGLLSGERRRELEGHVTTCSSCASVMASVVATREDPEDLPSGAAFGRYRIETRIGRGAMGTVYAARDPLLDRRVALKVLHASAGELPDVRERILREGRALARLSHPNVVEVYDVGEESGRLFLAMEIVSGSTLAAWSKSARRNWREVAAVFVQAGEALAAAHAAGVVHGDFKPENVIVSEDGRAFVMDFGLSRLHAPEAASERTPLLAGTPAYMAPEQLEGARATPASDQFAFSTALYEALYARRPFDAPSTFQLRARMREPLARPEGDAPGWLFSIVERGLDRDPSRRHASMDDLLRELRRRLSGEPHFAVNAVLQLLMLPFHAGVTAMFAWAIFSTDNPGPHKHYDTSTEAIGTLITLWLAGLFFSGWGPFGLIWGPLNAYGLFRKRRWAITSTLIYAVVSGLTCIGTPLAIYALVTLWPVRKKSATSR